MIITAIGRWGNFFNQEAYGPITTYANLKSMHIPTFIIDGMHIENNYYHPTFLYESLWNVGVLLLLLWWRKRKKFEGEILLLYLFGYGVGRFWIEGLRTDQLLIPGANLPVSQLLAIVLVLVSGIVMIYKRKKVHVQN